MAMLETDEMVVLAKSFRFMCIDEIARATNLRPQRRVEAARPRGRARLQRFVAPSEVWPSFVAAAKHQRCHKFIV